MYSDDFIDKLAEALTPRLAALLYPKLKYEPVPAQEWMTRAQAARYIGASTNALRHMLRAGMLPVYYVSGRERISKSDIDQMWRENKQFLTPENNAN
jgi:excisionase family DNA binding protein